MALSSTFRNASHRLVPTIALASLLLTACSKDDPEVYFPAVLPDTIAFTQAGLYPEGVQYDVNNSRFLVSSQTTGTIGQVLDDGTYSVFADNAALISTIGMNLDATRGRLFVAVSDPGYNTQRTSAATLRKMARLAIFSSSSPRTAPTVLDLTYDNPTAYPNHFANDIAVDAQGNVYVTDSFAPLIYKVTPNLVVTVFAENALFSAPAGAFGLNGIVYHPDGYLLVAKSNTGTIFKIPLANPAAISTVNTGGQNLQGADGMRLQDNNTLHVVCNAQAKVYRLATTDNWGSSAVSGTFNTSAEYPTTLAGRMVDNTTTTSYVLYSNLNALQANQQPPVSQFTIARVKF